MVENNFVISEKHFNMPTLAAGLYIISTPIGNLADITIRALQVLSGCKFLACENTKKTGILLQAYGIKNKRILFTEHNSKQQVKYILQSIKAGAAVGLVSDAGTPLISDPGLYLVQEAQSAGIKIVCIGGISSPIVAFVGSGFAAPFSFFGFVANKKQAKEKFFYELKEKKETLIFFETKNRIKSTLQVAKKIFGGGRKACLARELTKIHETFYKGTLEMLENEIGNMQNIKGEMILLIKGAENETIDKESLDKEIIIALQTMKASEVAKYIANKNNLSRKMIYQRVLALKEKL